MTDIEQENTAKIQQYDMVFLKLLESDRFKDLLNVYFTFQQVIDEESKEITLSVVENPPEVVAQRLRGSQPEPNVQIVSGSAAQAVLAQAKQVAKQRRSKR